MLGFSLPPILDLVDARAPAAPQIDGHRRAVVVARALPDAPTARAVELANELRLPVGEPPTVRLTSANVIHSFWIPSLAGKMDMIPGRTTGLRSSRRARAPSAASAPNTAARRTR